MKKTRAKATTAENLEAKFDRGEDVLDYFEAQKAQAIVPRRNASEAQCVVELSAEEQIVVHEPAGSYGVESHHRVGSVKGRTRSKNPVAGDYTKRDETRGSKKKGEFMDNKKGGKRFKGVPKEPDKRRK